MTCSDVMMSSVINTATARPAEPNSGSNSGVRRAWPNTPATRLLSVIPTWHAAT